jgi:hypothetical protein
VRGKAIELKTAGSLEMGEEFAASVTAGEGTIRVESDLTGSIF